MKSNNLAVRVLKALTKTKTLVGATVLGVAATVQVATMSTPAHALKLYAQQNGNAPCSTCHSRKGMTDGTMYPFTRAGKYFKNNGQLPRGGNSGGGNNGGGNNGGGNNGGGNNGGGNNGGGNNGGGNNGGGWNNNNNNNNGGNNGGRNNNNGWNNNGGNNGGRNNNNGGYNGGGGDPHVSYCRSKYRSYKARTDMYRGYDSRNHYCESRFRPGNRQKNRNLDRRFRRNRNNNNGGYSNNRNRNNGGYRNNGGNPPVIIIQQPPRQPPRNTNRGGSRDLTCNQARRRIERRGFRNVRAVNCNSPGLKGMRYTFHATNNRGQRRRLRFEAWSGRIYKNTRR